MNAQTMENPAPIQWAMYTAEDRPYCLNNAQEVGAEKVSDPNVKDAPEKNDLTPCSKPIEDPPIAEAHHVAPPAPTSPKKPLPDFMTMKEAERSLGLKKTFASAAFIEGKFSIDGKFCVTKPGRCNKCTVSRVPCIQPVEGRIRCSLCVRQGQSCYTGGRKRLRGNE
ncbi:uncharacterized protein H6S33_010814 [Morchella sextelata]|uniref:uncharacterized protein n=1 Tax=Morchella sextelata TaxID=1174677 RepID=UPI001D04423D|nr:uncharacterized protein H6S33_010814 [Morchella sextelata]KAH0611549.1 hypothetical protein H6S33_010814 [Morchella sextelata]